MTNETDHLPDFPESSRCTITVCSNFNPRNTSGIISKAKTAPARVAIRDRTICTAKGWKRCDRYNPDHMYQADQLCSVHLFRRHTIDIPLMLPFVTSGGWGLFPDCFSRLSWLYRLVSILRAPILTSFHLDNHRCRGADKHSKRTLRG